MRFQIHSFIHLSNIYWHLLCFRLCSQCRGDSDGETHSLIIKVRDGFANSQLPFRIIISTKLWCTKSMLKNSTSQWENTEYREKGSVWRCFEEQFVYAFQFPLPSHPEGELVLMLHPYPWAQRGASMGPEQLAVVSHSCKTQRPAPALVCNLKAGSTKQRWTLRDLPALSDSIGMING